jgi:hypothetical protein
MMYEEKVLGRTVEEKYKEKTVRQKHFCFGWITLLTGSQSSPALPHDKDRIKIKTLRCVSWVSLCFSSETVDVYRGASTQTQEVPKLLPLAFGSARLPDFK